MSKDPAFLFYPGDWLGGTITFSRSQKGAYMDLLMAQFGQYALTIEDIKQVLSSDYEVMWEVKLRSKFDVEAGGKLYFNRKLRDEILKRKSFCESRRNNKEGKNQYSGHMTSRKTSHMENENENENRNKDFKKPTIEEVKKYCNERRNRVDPSAFVDFYESKGWMIGKNKMKSWQAAVRTWEKTHGFKPKEDSIISYKPDPKQQEEVSKLIRKTANDMSVLR